MNKKKYHLKIDKFWFMLNIPRRFSNWAFIAGNKNAELMLLQNWLAFHIDGYTFDPISDHFIFFGKNYKIPSLKKLRAENCNLTYLDIYEIINN